MPESRIAVVWNPSKTSKETLESALHDVDGDVRWYETTPDDLGAGAANAALKDGADLVFACGGDGTVRAVIQALAEVDAEAEGQRVELGIVPLGTGNLLARNLGVPLGDARIAIRHAFETPARPIDVGWVALNRSTERHAFAVMAGFGIDAHMITETNADLKDQVGWMAYLESLGRAVSASEVIDMTVTVDGRPPHNDSAHTLIVGNCGTLQAGIVLLPDADPTDGLLDVLVLNAETVVGWLGTLHNLVWDNGIRRLLQPGTRAHSNSNVHHEQMTRLTIELADARVIEVDGDELEEATHIDISLQPAAVVVRGA